MQFVAASLKLVLSCRAACCATPANQVQSCCYQGVQMTYRSPTGAAILLVLSGTASAQTPDPAAACAAMKQLQVPGVNLEVTKAEWIPAGSLPPGRGAPASNVKLPAYCRIDGMVDKRTGAAGATYGIGFAIALPQNWNGRFLLQGGGGLNGSVQPPIGANAAGNEPGLARGFAVASTDTGHEGKGGFDGSFQQDQLASLDFAYIAIGRFAEIAKRIVAQHYGK